MRHENTPEEDKAIQELFSRANGMTNVIEQRPPKINSVTIRRAIREIERMRAEEEARRWRMWHLYGIEVRNWQRPIINVTA